MKAKIFFLIIFLVISLFSCGSSEEISSDQVDDRNNQDSPVTCDNDGICENGETEKNCVVDCVSPNENQAPSFINIADRTVMVGTNVAFRVQATDPDNDKVTLSWEIPNGASFSGVSNNSVTVTGNFSWTPGVAGTYKLKFAATDDNNDPKVSNLTVTIIVTALPPPNHIVGTLSWAGLSYIFDFTDQKITLTNTNPYIVRLCGSFYCNKYMEAGAMETFNAGFGIGQQIEIQVWKGEAAAWYPTLHGNSVDLVGRAILDNSAFNANTSYSEWASYVAPLKPINGFYCEHSGRYNKNDITKQTNHTLYCYNSSANYVKVEIYHIVPASGNKYKNNVKLGTIHSIAPGYDEIIKIDYTYASTADLLAVRISTPVQTVTPYMLEMNKDKTTKLGLTVEITD